MYRVDFGLAFCILYPPPPRAANGKEYVDNNAVLHVGSSNGTAERGPVDEEENGTWGGG